MIVKAAHFSGQFSDTPVQMEHDIRTMFRRKYAWWTGTEAGNPDKNPMNGILRRLADTYDYKIRIERGEYVAVHRAYIDGPFRGGFVPVIESYEGKGRHSDRGITWVQFPNNHLGMITIGAGHYLTKGRSPKQTPGGINFRLNKEYAEAIDKWGIEAGRGAALAFYHGDQNIVDRRADTFFGGNFKSSWDELGRWENTGHGNIDVIASLDRDGRVTARSVRALDDRELRMYSDHFVVETTWNIRELNGR